VVPPSQTGKRYAKATGQGQYSISNTHSVKFLQQQKEKIGFGIIAGKYRLPEFISDAFINA
jgi:hypothetical protein